MAIQQHVCEVCGRKGAAADPALGCYPGELPTAPNPIEITHFTMGVYSLRICRGCRDRHSDEALRTKLREKVKHTRTLDT